MELDYGDLLILALHDVWESVNSDAVERLDGLVRFAVHAGTEGRVIERYTESGVRPGLMQAIVDHVKNEGKEENHVRLT